jgi:hypothetical protein
MLKSLTSFLLQDKYVLCNFLLQYILLHVLIIDLFSIKNYLLSWIF